MIDIRDLTIGNWVFDGNHTKFPMQITSLSEGYVTMSFPSNEGMDWESKPEDLQGIPLTEELMKDNGFRFNGVWWHKQEADYTLDVSVGLAYTQIEKWVNGGIHSRCTCHGVRFVHELQNLFWNITRQQLNIKI